MVRSYRAHKPCEFELKDKAATTINMKDWPITIKGLVEYLKGSLGVTKIPSDYVIRDNPMVLPEPPGGHITQQQELITRATILTVGSALFC